MAILHFGPYKVDSDCDTNCYNDDSLKYLKENIKGLLKFPRNKLMRLREALFEEKEIRKLILEEFSVKDLNLPKLPFKKRLYYRFMGKQKKLHILMQLKQLIFIRRDC